jgi:hypothetical protein
MLVGNGEDPSPGLGLGPFLVGDRDGAAVVIAHPEAATSLPAHEQQSGVAEVDHVVDQDAERLGYAQAHHALQPQGQLVNRMKAGGDPCTLGQAQGARLRARPACASDGHVGGGRLQSLRGVEAGRHDPVRSREAENATKDPQRVGDHGLRQPRQALASGEPRDGRLRNADPSVRVAVGAGQFTGAPASSGGSEADPAHMRRLAESELPVLPGLSEIGRNRPRLIQLGMLSAHESKQPLVRHEVCDVAD